jgi:phosphotriesterase-related protein
MKRVITTVLGDIAPERFGFCQSHEHLCIAPGYPAFGSPELCIDDVEKSCGELNRYHRAGGSAVVDAQPLGCGRDASMLREISEKSGVHIIASTGLHKMGYYPGGHWIYSAGADDITRLYLTELTRGMYIDGDSAFPEGQCAYRAGQIKTALDAGTFTPQYEKLFTAAAEAAKASGTALMVHIEKDSAPLGLADFLYRQGMELERVIFCHMDRAIADIAVHREICSRHISLEYDTIGRPKYHDDEHEIGIILEMVQAGYEKQMLMSLDTTRARLQSYGGVPGLTWILEGFIPLLRRHGITDEQVRLFFTENPARAFSHC